MEESTGPSVDVAPQVAAPTTDGAAPAESTAAPGGDPSGSADHATELAADYSNIDAWIKADAERINAEAAQAVQSDETEASAPADAPAALTTAPAAEAQPDSFDEAAALSKLSERGYKLEPPPPPPDPAQAVTNELIAWVGTPEEYQQAQQAALVQLPSEPQAYDADTVARHEQAVAARNQAAARLQTMNAARRITDISRQWANQYTMGQLGSALSGLPEQYGLSAEQAARVTRPQTMTDAVAAVVEAVTAKLEKHWQGEVKRARTDRSADSLQRLGRAPQAAAGAGGRAAGPPEMVFDLDPRTGLPTEASIQKAIRGEYANVDLSDR